MKKLILFRFLLFCITTTHDLVIWFTQAEFFSHNF